MLVPESLWIPTLKDSVSQFAPQRVARFVNVSAEAAIVGATLYTVPQDQVFVLTSWNIVGSSTNLSILENVLLLITDTVNGALSNTLHMLFSYRATVPGATSGPLFSNDNNSHPSCVQGQVIVMPTEVIRGVVTTTGPVNVVGMTASVSGVLIPRGNWQLG